MSLLARLPWPLPALLAWALAWLVFVALQPVASPVWAVSAACALAASASLWGGNWWRRGLIAAGFPLALALTGWVSLPAWAWLVPLLLLLAVYPLNAWRDAPLFPTPHAALQGLSAQVPLAPGARVLDAGCGLGDGLMALRRAYPQAQLEGVEWSWPLRVLCGLRCPWARVRRTDMWEHDWSGYALVYLFQRPETMPRAVGKALAELAPGAWLVSLEFAAPGLLPQAQLRLPGGRVVWIYCMPDLKHPPESPSAPPLPLPLSHQGRGGNTSPPPLRGRGRGRGDASSSRTWEYWRPLHGGPGLGRAGFSVAGATVAEWTTVLPVAGD